MFPLLVAEMRNFDHLHMIGQPSPADMTKVILCRSFDDLLMPSI